MASYNQKLFLCGFFFKYSLPSVPYFCSMFFIHTFVVKFYCRMPITTNPFLFWILSFLLILKICIVFVIYYNKYWEILLNFFVEANKNFSVTWTLRLMSLWVRHFVSEELCDFFFIFLVLLVVILRCRFKKINGFQRLKCNFTAVKI